MYKKVAHEKEAICVSKHLKIWFPLLSLFLCIVSLVLAPPIKGDEPNNLCPEGMYAIYNEDDILISCEEYIGTPENCPEDAVAGYLENGTLAGCFTSDISTEEICSPIDVDEDGDGLDDGCDPCLGNNDCDNDGFIDGIEAYVGTDPTDACSDDPSEDAWPPDFNKDAIVNILDVLLFKPVLGTEAGDSNYNNRFDLNVDRAVSILDVLLFKPIFGLSCENPNQLQVASDAQAQASGWHFKVKSQTLGAHGELRWQIPLPWPLPDIVQVKYRMDLWVTFIWLDYFNVSGPTRISCFTDFQYPYYIGDHPIISGGGTPAPTSWRVGCEVNVWVFPEFYYVWWPIKLWIDWTIPGYYGGGGFGFNRMWIEPPY